MKHPKYVAGSLLALGVLAGSSTAPAQAQHHGEGSIVNPSGRMPQAHEERGAGAGLHRPDGAGLGAMRARQGWNSPWRRSVQQSVGPLPPTPGTTFGAMTPWPAPPATYGPTLPPAPGTTFGPTTPVPSASYGSTLSPGPSTMYGSTLSPAPSAIYGNPLSPPPPALLNSCAGNFCTDASGNSYNAGVGNAAVNSQGRLCNRMGNTMQCF